LQGGSYEILRTVAWQAREALSTGRSGLLSMACSLNVLFSWIYFVPAIAHWGKKVVPTILLV